MSTVTNILGETRKVERTWEDGSYQCPFCSGPVSAGSDCGNPGCEANPSLPREWVLKQREAEKVRRAEEEERQRILRIRYAAR